MFGKFLEKVLPKDKDSERIAEIQKMAQNKMPTKKDVQAIQKRAGEMQAELAEEQAERDREYEKQLAEMLGENVPSSEKNGQPM